MEVAELEGSGVIGRLIEVPDLPVVLSVLGRVMAPKDMLRPFLGEPGLDDVSGAGLGAGLVGVRVSDFFWEPPSLDSIEGGPGPIFFGLFATVFPLFSPLLSRLASELAGDAVPSKGSSSSSTNSSWVDFRSGRTNACSGRLKATFFLPRGSSSSSSTSSPGFELDTFRLPLLLLLLLLVLLRLERRDMFGVLGTVTEVLGLRGVWGLLLWADGVADLCGRLCLRGTIGELGALQETMAVDGEFRPIPLFIAALSAELFNLGTRSLVGGDVKSKNKLPVLFFPVITGTEGSGEKALSHFNPSSLMLLLLLVVDVAVAWAVVISVFTLMLSSFGGSGLRSVSCFTALITSFLVSVTGGVGVTEGEARESTAGGLPFLASPDPKLRKNHDGLSPDSSENFITRSVTST